MKVLLVNPPDIHLETRYREYSLGLGYLATVSNQFGNECQILDMGVDNQSLEEKIKSFNPQMIGLSLLSVNFPEALKLLPDIKKVFDGPLVAGGVHSTLFPAEVLSSGFDFAVMGEGEITLQELIKNLRHPEKIQGLAYSDDGKIVINSKRQIIKNLDELPFPDRDLYNLKFHLKHTLMSSRGCVYNCKFCCNWKIGELSSRTRSAKNIFDEVRYLYDKYGARFLYFSDDNFGLHRETKMELCDLIEKSGMKLNWSAQMRGDLVDEALFDSMKRAGCSRVYFGVESGSQEILDQARKRMNVSQIKRGILAAKKSGLSVKAGFIVGLPGTYEQNLQSLALMKETLPDEIAVFHFVPLPGTEYWSDAEKYGIRIRDKGDLNNLYFYGIPNNINFDYITKEEIVRLFETFEVEMKNLGYHRPDEDSSKNKLIVTPLNRDGYVKNKIARTPIN